MTSNYSNTNMVLEKILMSTVHVELQKY